MRVELTHESVGNEVVLNGWIENFRHHGSLLFLDVRDRYGVTQVVFDAEHKGTPKGLLDRAVKLGAEDVISVRGRVALRASDKVNKKRSTGAIEVFAEVPGARSLAPTPGIEPRGT